MSTLYRSWGLTGAYAYRAYNDPQFLNGAIEIWEEFTPMVITTDDASTGIHPMKNVTFMSQCNNGEVLLSQRVIGSHPLTCYTASVAGAIFDVNMKRLISQSPTTTITSF